MIPITALMLFLPLSAEPDLAELANDLVTLMEEERQGRHGSPDILGKYPFTTEEELALLDPYFDDDSRLVRQRAVGLLGEAAIFSEDRLFRQRAVRKFVTILEPSRPDLCSSIARRLNSTSYYRSDFTDETRAILTKKLLDWPSPLQGPTRNYAGDLVELMAKAELHGALPFVDRVEAELHAELGVDPLDREPRIVSKSLGFVCLAVRAHLGDDAAMKRLGAIYSELESDIDRMETFAYIGFMRRPEVIELLRPLLNSKVIRPGPSGRTERDVLAEPIASSASWKLFNMLEGYPRTSDLNECRQWMNRRPPGFKWEFKR